MGTATVQTGRISSLKTGAGLEYPVIMKAPYDYTEYIWRLAIKDSTEIAIGDIAQIAAGVLDATSAALATVSVIILDTEWNKALLAAAGSTVNKTSQFLTTEKVDVLPLLPGFILSMKVEAKADHSMGTELIANDTAGQLTAGVTAGAVIGMSLDELDWTDVADELFYCPVLVK